MLENIFVQNQIQSLSFYLALNLFNKLYEIHVIDKNMSSRKRNLPKHVYPDASRKSNYCSHKLHWLLIQYSSRTFYVPNCAEMESVLHAEATLKEVMV